MESCVSVFCSRENSIFLKAPKLLFLHVFFTTCILKKIKPPFSNYHHFKFQTTITFNCL